MNETRRAVLDALADGPVTGPVLADRLGVSRTAVWKHVEALRDAGYVIEGGESGYAIEAIPEFGPGVGHGLDAFDIEFHDSIASTNDRARELAARGAEDVVVLADEQTAGRGRLDRDWVSPSGGIWTSVLLRPDVPPRHAPLLTLAAAVATACAIREAIVGTAADTIRVGLKWPNDVLLADGDEDRKVAGILTEMEGETDEVSWMAIGIGVNANVDASRLPPGATSLHEHAGDVDRRLLVEHLLDELHRLRSDPDAVLPGWRDLSFTVGRRVRIQTAHGTVDGTAVDVEFPGALVVETDDGARVQVHAGDCEHLRPV